MPCVAHLMLVMVLNMPEQCSFQDLLSHLLFMPKYAEKSASRMDISLKRWLGRARGLPPPSVGTQAESKAEVSGSRAETRKGCKEE